MNQDKQIQIASKLLEWMDAQGQLNDVEKICTLRTAASIIEQKLTAAHLASIMLNAHRKP